MKKLTLAWTVVALLASTQAWAAPTDHPTVLTPSLAASPPARAFVGGLPAFDTCPTITWQLASWKVWLAPTPTDPGTVAATIPTTLTPPTVSWTCAAPLPAGTYYLSLSLVDPQGNEGGRSSTVGFIIGTPPATFSLTLTTAGTGMGSVSGQGSYAPGTPVTLTAVPSPTSTFTSWTPAPCAVTFTMPAAPLLCTATFTLKPPPPVIGVGSPIFVNTAVGVLLNVRATAGGPILGTQVRGATGTVTGGPTVINGVTWWQITYTNAPSGWSSGTYLSLTAP